jgi:sensor histidine kinase YesM
MPRALLLKYKLHHVFFWMLVFGAWYFFRANAYPSRQMALEVTLVKVVDLALLVYITNYLLIPFLLYKKRYLLFAIAFISLVVGSSLLKMNILGKVTSNPWLYDLNYNWRARIYDNVIPHFFLVIAGAAFKLVLDYGKLQKRMAETAREKAETELNFLKSQINPHFLFNSLNSVYFLIDRGNTEAREALHKFSGMLRYQLYGVRDDRIDVQKEIGYLRDYVAMQKLRRDEQYEVEFNCGPGLTGFSIEPLLLLPFVENAFKHVSHSQERRNYIHLGLMRENGSLYFHAENSRDLQAKQNDPDSGIGLANVKRRLELLYPGRHELLIEERPDLFRVNLRLKI